MKILLIDDMDLRREILARHTGAEVVRVMPRELFNAPELLLGVDAIALDYDMCEGGPEDEAPRCPRPSAYGGCTCPDGRDVVRFLLDRFGTLKHGCRIIVVSANPVGALGMLRDLENPRARAARVVHVGLCSAARWGRHDNNTRGAIRAAFGLPLDFEVTT